MKVSGIYFGTRPKPGHLNYHYCLVLSRKSNTPQDQELSVYYTFDEDKKLVLLVSVRPTTQSDV